MSLYPGPSADTLRALETAPNMYLVLSPELYILIASDLYLEATGATREAIVGKHIFEAFPNNPNVPDIDGVQNINASLQEVLRTRKRHYMRIQRYDVPDLNHPGKFIQRYWDPSHTPVLNEQGEIEYIIQLATNVTEKVLTETALAESKAEEQKSMEKVHILNLELAASNADLKQSRQSLLELYRELERRVEARTQELAESEEKFRSLVEQSPIALQVLRGDQLVYETINDATLH